MRIELSCNTKCDIIILKIATLSAFLEKSKPPELVSLSHAATEFEYVQCYR